MGLGDALGLGVGGVAKDGGGFDPSSVESVSGGRTGGFPGGGGRSSINGGGGFASRTQFGGTPE